MRRFAAVIGAAALAVVPVAGLSVIAASPAAAHDVLVATSPEDGAVVTEPPDVVELTFDNAVQNRFAQVVVFDSNETPHQQGDPKVVGPTVTQQVDELPNAEYTVSYRIVSSDGHPVSGSFSFTVAASGSRAPSATTAPQGGAATPDAATSPEVTEATPAPSNAATDGNDGGIGTPAVIAMSAAAAVVVAAIAFLAAGGRRRPGSATDADP